MELGELIDNAPETLSRIARLWSVSSNYEYPSPATVFIDLIGYTEEEFGEPLTTMKEAVRRLDFVGLGLIGQALDEYTDRPNDARVFIQELLDAEGR
jgi:hypothetical protein